MGKHRKLNLILLVLTVIIFIMMGVSFAANNSSVSTPGSILGTVFRPAWQFFSYVGNGVGGFFDYLGDMRNFQSENLELKDQVAALSEQVREMDGYKQENERLRRLLELSSREEGLDMVGCEVIAKDPGNWFYTFTIDKGSHAGLAIDDAVISDRGLVGRITEVGPNWSKVLTIIDADSSVGALVNRTQSFAIVDGDLTLGDHGQCQLNHIAAGNSLVPGDTIVTSGLGGIYPEGILIGTVLEVKSDSLGYSQYAVVDTAVDFERIREVMVVRNGR
ncbi:MAG: rod shape-determining protein MreC [Ruminococcaceae bacterium]|nr:rod shape-determining protein MreC [Oscillospiraceae bacterium]